MKLIEKLSFVLWAFFWVAPLPAIAQFNPSVPALPVGTAVIRPEAVEDVIRELIADAVSGSLDDDDFTIMAPGFHQELRLPQPAPPLKQILDAVGIKERLGLTVAPIQVKFNLPESDLKIDVKKINEDSFIISGKWSLRRLKASSSRVSIKVPAGLFPQAFTIDSNPVKLSMLPNSVPVEFEADFLAHLDEEGATFKLQSFKTNLEDPGHPQLAVTLGTLTVNGRPLTLDVFSNGEKLSAREPAIRAQFQNLGPMIADVVRSKIYSGIAKQVTKQAGKLALKKPFKYEGNTNKFLDKFKLTPAMRELMGNIDYDFHFSSFKAEKSIQLYTAEITSHICFDGKCLSERVAASPINESDLKVIPPADQWGAVIDESVLQNFFNSPEFQDRLHRYYKATSKSLGVGLAPAGVRVFLHPTENSILAVLNLEIDIDETIKKDAPLGKRLKTLLGDAWEILFGAGEIIHIPIEVTFKLEGIQKDENGNPVLKISSELPFEGKDGLKNSGHCPQTICPSNVDKMTKLVKADFLKSVRIEMEHLIPQTLIIPMSKKIKLKQFEIIPQTIQVTSNHGMLMTGKLKFPRTRQ